jgi:hypothetical protein
MTRTFIRSHAFDGPDPIGQILDWCASKGGATPAVYVGPDNSVRGSVELAREEMADDDEETTCPA